MGYKNIITYTYDWGLTTDTARKNISHFCQMYKIENRSLSKIYKDLSNPSQEIQSLISEILGKSQFPTFAQFKAKAKKEQIYFSVYSGLLIVKQFNKIAKTRSKVAKQNKATSNK